MTYKSLIKQRRIKAYDANEKEIQRFLEIASWDLTTAESTIEVNPDWAYTISHKAMFQSSRALMLQKGYRPI